MPTTSKARVPAKLDEDFKARITPKLAAGGIANLFLRCKCGKAHWRHAGYIGFLTPFASVNEKTELTKKVALDREQVLICVSCKKAYCWINGQMYDVSSEIDLAAWEKTEADAYRATGPGGEC